MDHESTILHEYSSAWHILLRKKSMEHYQFIQ